MTVGTDLDIPQDPMSKFNLGLELATITRGGRYHAADNRILKAKREESVQSI